MDYKKDDSSGLVAVLESYGTELATLSNGSATWIIARDPEMGT
jgi:hypothetical protein